jgi:hypothetical protein
MSTIYVDCPRTCGDEIELEIVTHDADDGQFAVAEGFTQHCQCELSDDERASIEEEAVEKYWDGVGQDEPDFNDYHYVP